MTLIEALDHFLFGLEFGVGFQIAIAVCGLIAQLFSRAGQK